MEINENKQEIASDNAINDVNSSIILVFEVSEICKEVITKRQNPRRFAAVPKICWDVLFAINIKDKNSFFLPFVLSAMFRWPFVHRTQSGRFRAAQVSLWGLV